MRLSLETRGLNDRLQQRYGTPDQRSLILLWSGDQILRCLLLSAGVHAGHCNGRHFKVPKDAIPRLTPSQRRTNVGFPSLCADLSAPRAAKPSSVHDAAPMMCARCEDRLRGLSQPIFALVCSAVTSTHQFCDELAAATCWPMGFCTSGMAPNTMPEQFRGFDVLPRLPYRYVGLIMVRFPNCVRTIEYHVLLPNLRYVSPGCSVCKGTAPTSPVPAN